MDAYRGRSLIFIWWLIILIMGTVSNAQMPPNIRVSSLTSTNGITNYTRLLLGTNGWPDEGVSLTNLFLFSTHASSNSTIPFIYFNRFQDKMSGGDPNARVFGFTEELFEGTNFNGQVAQAIRGFTGLPSTNVNNTNLVYDHSGIVGVYGVNTFFKLDNSAPGESAGIVGADYSSHRVKFGSIGIAAPINTNQVMVGGASVALGDLNAHGSIYVGHYAEAASIDNNPQTVPWTNAVMLLENRAHSNNIPFIIAGSTPPLSGTRTVEFSVHDGGHTTAGSVTNNGGYKHPTGAFSDAIFKSADALGNAVWSTNIASLVVTQLFIGTNGGQFNVDCSVTGGRTNIEWFFTKPAFRAGSIAGGVVLSGLPAASNYWDCTNIGNYSSGFGSNILVAGHFSTIAGGANNAITTNTVHSFIGGGSNNIIRSNIFSVLVGGADNFISNRAEYAFLGGGFNNFIGSNAQWAVVVGGQQNNSLTNHSAIVGGAGNSVSQRMGFIGGGQNNTVQGNHGAILGGELNNVRGVHSVIVGGLQNSLAATGDDFCFIGGGANNRIGVATSSPSDAAVITGGSANTIDNDADYSVIAGGTQNDINGGCTNGVISGGELNSIGANSINGIIPGGLRNVISATTGDFGVILGHSNNVSQAFGVAIGKELTNSLANTVDVGHGDSTKTTFATTNVTFRSGISVGPSPAYITNILVGSATLDFGSTGAGLTNDLPITVTSTTTNDFPQLCIPFQAIANGGVFFPFMSNDTVWVRFVNPSGTAIDPPQAVFRAMVTKTR